MSANSKLFEPIEICGVEVKNRITMAPMGIMGLTTSDGCFSQRAIDYYVERAKGGVGLIVTSLTKIEDEIEKIRPGTFPNLSLNPARFIQSGTEMTERVHAFGSKIFLQLTIGFGRVGDPALMERETVAPSPIPNYWSPTTTCRELTTEEVETLVRRAGMGAYVASESGFDGVEIHAVHEGYLLDQFTIDMFNDRMDKYGGDLEGRLRFPVEIVHTIKDTVGEDFPVSLRYSVKSYVKDWNQGGLPGEDFEEKGRDVDEGLKAAKMLEKAGYDAFNADAGSYDAWYWAHPPNYQEHGCLLPLTKKLKEVVEIPVLAAGRLERPELARKVVEEEKADMISLGRGLLADPEWPNKVLKNNPKDIRPCLGGQSGCLGRISQGKPISCSVNPACGREREYSITPSGQVKNVIVVGGGVAGMEAARIARLRGHEVTLFEKNSELGGHLIESSVPDFKKDERRLLEWYERQLTKLDVEIDLNEKVTSELIDEEGPDVVIVATGSNPIIPEVPGVEKDMVITAIDLLLDAERAGGEMVVIGGGLVGCETTLWLTELAKA